MEVLIVMAIVLVLAGMLIPSASRFVAKGKEAKCASNLHQLYVAMTGFANDHGGRIVRPLGDQNGDYGDRDRYAVWSDALAEYVGKDPLTYGHPAGTRPQGVFACPVSKLVTTGGARSDYGLNSMVQTDRRGTRTMASIEKPAQTFILVDATHPNQVNCPRSVPTYPSSATQGLDFRHHGSGKDGRVNALFLDGHVASLTLTDFPPLTGNYWQKIPWAADPIN